MAKRRDDRMGPLPPEVRALGRPLSVHPPSRGWTLFDGPIDLGRTGYAVAAGVFLVTSPCLLALYFFGQFQPGDPVWAFALAAAIGLVLGVGCASYAAFRPASTEDGPEPRSAVQVGYLVFQEALVTCAGESFDILRWDEVRELWSPAATGDRFRLVARDGRTIDVGGWVEDEGMLRQALVEHVTAAQLPDALSALQEGRRVRFGDFGVSLRGMTYKDRRIAWEDVSSMVIRTGRIGRRLHVRQSGAVLAWCSIDLDRLPNNDLLYQLLVQAAPARLLRSAE